MPTRTGESLAALVAVERDGPLLPLLPLLSPTLSTLPTNVARCAKTSLVATADGESAPKETPPVATAAGESAPKKKMTSKDENSMGQKDPAKSKVAGYAKTSAPKKKQTSKEKISKEVSVGVALTALKTNKDSDYNNVPSAAQSAKQANIEVRRAASTVKDYSDLSGALKKKKKFSNPKSAPKKKKASTNTTKTQTSKEVRATTDAMRALLVAPSTSFVPTSSKRCESVSLGISIGKLAEGERASQTPSTTS